MRFFRWHAWRAIRELDALTPDRAAAFVRSTRNLRGWRAARWGLTTLVLFPSMWVYVAMLALVAIALHSSIDAFMDDNRQPAAVKFLVIAGSVVSPLLGGFIAHRFMTLQAVRSALTRRGRCEGCGYTLSGLPLGANDAVRCPECGREVVSERGLGEVREVGGREVFDPPARVFRWQISRASAWKWAKRGAVGTALVVVLLGAWWGWAEWTLRRDAAEGAADRTGIAPLRAMWLARQPAGSSPDDANAWTEFQNARARIASADKEVWDTPGTQPDVRPLYDALDNTLTDASPEQVAGYDAGRALAERMLEPLRKAGVFDAWKRMREAPRREIAISVPPGEPAVSLPSPEISQLREAARINKARMVVAARDGRLDEFVDALKTSTALAGMSAEYPSIVGSLVACAVDALAFRQVRNVLARHPSAEWLDGIDAALKPDRPRPPRSYGLEADRQMVLDTMAYAFTNVKLIRRRRFESWFGDDHGRRTPVGTYAANKAMIDAPMLAVVQAADHERYERAPLPEFKSTYIMVETLRPYNEKALTSQDQLELERRGLAIMIAIERYRLAHGEPPGSLNELCPAFLSAVPIDPWSGKPLCYRRFSPGEAKADPQGREYLLWSVGGDGVDNGGRMVDSRADRHAVVATKKFSGFDFIVNDRDR